MVVDKFETFEREFWRDINTTGDNNSPLVYTMLSSNDSDEFFTETLGSIEGPWSNNNAFTLHEFGCSVGRHLNFVRSKFENVTVSGNDISNTALELGRKTFNFSDNELFNADTFEFIMNASTTGKKFDVLISYMHTMHLNDVFVQEIFPSFIPRMCNFFFCHELQTNEPHSCSRGPGMWYARDYMSMFMTGTIIVSQSNGHRLNYHTVGWKFV